MQSSLNFQDCYKAFEVFSSIFNKIMAINVLMRQFDHKLLLKNELISLITLQFFFC